VSWVSSSDPTDIQIHPNTSTPVGRLLGDIADIAYVPWSLSLAVCHVCA